MFDEVMKWRRSDQLKLMMTKRAKQLRFYCLIQAEVKNLQMFYCFISI